MKGTNGMKLISINIGQEQTLTRPNKTEQTGIFKQPVAGPVQLTKDGLPGDFIGDHKNHGGPDQAIYIYGMADYEWWAREIGRETCPGMFGDNLTISDLASANFNIGDLLHIGEVTLQVTSPRIPCGTLAGRMGMPSFAKQFRFAGRPGLYCRVISEGTLQSGETVRVEQYPGETVSVIESMRDFYEPELTEAAIRRHLNAPIAIRTRAEKEAQLQKLLTGA
jgi:MOSC domain-containing protein YiiM